MLPVFYTVGAQTSNVLPFPTLLLGRILPVFYRLAARPSTVLPSPFTTVGADAARFLYSRRLGRTFTVLDLPPHYT